MTFKTLLGGMLLGWGSLLAPGCTVGTLLSGVMAGAASGWMFGLFCLLGRLLACVCGHCCARAEFS